MPVAGLAFLATPEASDRLFEQTAAVIYPKSAVWGSDFFHKFSLGHMAATAG
jgi:hypothetical protein